MSRIINLRSPYFVKVESSDSARILDTATLQLYIWEGSVTNRTNASLRHTLAKNKNPLEDFIVFEISEYIRDFVDVRYDGTNRVTNPVFIGVEVTKTYSNTDAEEIEYQILWGLDGYRDHAEGLDGFSNLIRTAVDPPTGTGQDGLITPTISFTANTSTAAQSITAGTSVTLAAVVNPPESEVTIYRDSTLNQIAVLSANQAKTFTISNFQAGDAGTYFAIARYTNTDAASTVRESLQSNAVALTLATGRTDARLTPSSNTFSASTGDAETYTLITDSQDTAPAIGGISAPSWLSVTGLTAGTTVGTTRTQTFTATTSAANTGGNSRSGNITVTYGSPTQTVTATVTQTGAGFQAPSQPTISIVRNVGGGENTNIGNSGDTFTMTSSTATDPAGGNISYQWYLGGTSAANRIEGAGGTAAEGGTTYTTEQNSAGTRTYNVAATSSVSGLTTFSAGQSVQHRGGPTIAFADGQIFESATSIPIRVTASDPAGGTLTYGWEIDEGSGFISLGSATSVTVTGGGINDTTASISTTSQLTVRIRVRATSSESGLVSPYAGTNAGQLFTFTGSGSTAQNTNPRVAITQSTSSTGPFSASSGTADLGTYFQVTGAFDSADNISREETTESFTRFTDNTFTTSLETILASSIVRFRNVAGEEFWSYTPNNELSSATANRATFTLSWVAQLVARWELTSISYNQENAGRNLNFTKTAGIQASDYVISLLDTGDGTGWITPGTPTGQDSSESAQAPFNIARNNTEQSRSLTMRISINRGRQTQFDDITISQAGNVPGEITSFTVSPTGSFPSNSEIAQVFIGTDVSTSAWRLTVNIANTDQVFTGSGTDQVNVTIPANTLLRNRNITFTVTGVGATTLASGLTNTITRVQLASSGSGGTTPGNQEQ